MKKLFLLAASCLSLSFAANAQAGSLDIDNNTDCPFYFELLGDLSPGCGTAYESPSLYQPWVSFTSYNTASTPFNCPACPPPNMLGPGDYINAIRIYLVDPACPMVPTTITLGELCSGFPQSAIMPFINLNCVQCNNLNGVPVTATWTPAPFPGGTALLKLN